jgi:hypothetical protein
LQGLTGPFLRQAGSRQAPQLLIDQRQQFFSGRFDGFGLSRFFVNG